MGTRGLTVLIPVKAVSSQDEARRLAVPVAAKEGFEGEPTEEQLDDPDPSWAFRWEKEWS